MISRETSLEEICSIVKKCLDKLYSDDALLFAKNAGRAIHENCLVFRFALYLQNELSGVFFVDHDFNSSFAYRTDENGNFISEERSGKKFVDLRGIERDCLVDIIVHERDYDGSNDFICFEFKKWNSKDFVGFAKDESKLKYLTTYYNYIYGFHVIFGETKNDTKWTIFSGGRALEQKQLIYGN